MDVADDELRDTIRMIWPLQADKMTDLLVPRREKGGEKRTLTAGKIYAGLLILDSWRTTRFGKIQSHMGVSQIWSCANHIFISASFNFRARLCPRSIEKKLLTGIFSKKKISKTLLKVPDYLLRIVFEIFPLNLSKNVRKNA